jgi:hypothetical protein
MLIDDAADDAVRTVSKVKGKVKYHRTGAWARPWLRSLNLMFVGFAVLYDAGLGGFLTE